jgi:hypothetical protein
MEEDDKEEELSPKERVSIDPPSFNELAVGILAPPLHVPVLPLPVTGLMVPPLPDSPSTTTTKNINIMHLVSKELPKKKASKLKFKNLQRRIRIEGD